MFRITISGDEGYEKCIDTEGFVLNVIGADAGETLAELPDGFTLYKLLMLMAADKRLYGDIIQEFGLNDADLKKLYRAVDAFDTAVTVSDTVSEDRPAE